MGSFAGWGRPLAGARRRRMVCASLAPLIGVAAASAAFAAHAPSRGGAAIKIVLLAEDEGESADALPFYADGAELAAADLEGEVDLVRIPTPVTPVEAENALRGGVQESPVGIIGLPASSQVEALGPTIGGEGVPFVALSTIGSAVKGGPSGADNLFFIRPVSNLVARRQARYVAKALGAQSVGLLCVNDPVGTTGCEEARDVLQRRDVDVAVERTNDAAATDLTEQALAMQDVDVVLDFNFPNPLGMFANQLIDNGIEVDHVDGASAGIAVSNGAVRGPAAENLIGVDDCVPAEDKRRRVKRWVRRYEREYDSTPVYASAEAYDAVMIMNEAVRLAGSTDPTAVVAALRSMSYEGICTDYETDPTNVMNHASAFVGFDADGNIEVLKRFTVGEVKTGDGDAAGEGQAYEYPAGGPPDPIFPTEGGEPAAQAYELLSSGNCEGLLGAAGTWGPTIDEAQGPDTPRVYRAAAYACLGRWDEAQRIFGEIEDPQFAGNMTDPSALCARNAVYAWVDALLAARAEDPSFSPDFVISSGASPCPVEAPPEESTEPTTEPTEPATDPTTPTSDGGG